jgi:Ca2+-binding EF-hand superfamily protein
LGTIEGTKSANWSLAGAYAEFARLDLDRSGALTGKELESLPNGIDANDDRRGTFAEFARATAALPPSAGITAVLEAPRIRATRTDPDGDLARLFDLVDPRAFDKDQDSRLSRSELEAAWFAALDLDGDRALTSSESSRAPGPLRKLRYGDSAAKKLFDALDTDGNGKLTSTESRARDEDWRSLDANEDGFVQLPVVRRSKAARTGKPMPASEWPTRRILLAPLAPDATLDQILAQFDKNGDRNLSKAELETRPYFLVEMDDNDDDLLGYVELKVRCDVLLQLGVDVLHDGFLERWDRNRDGRVTADELPLAPWLRARLGL